MSAKLFIGGLSWGTNDTTLRAAFEKYGEVTDAKVILDRTTGRSRGFGFVTYADDQNARDAVDAMNLQELDGREVRVDFASERSDGGSGGRGGSGGYRSGPYDRNSGGGGRRDYGSSNWRDSSSRGGSSYGGSSGGRRGGYDDDYSRRSPVGDGYRRSGGDRYEDKGASGGKYDD